MYTILKRTQRAKNNKDIYAYGCVTTLLRDFEKFPYLIFFPLHDILFRAVFLFTGQKRITLHRWHLENFCQDYNNEKSYFVFDSEIKIFEFYIDSKPA